MKEKMIEVEVIQGVEGRCLSVNNNRVAGPKPWGGGEIVNSFEVPLSQLLEAIGLDHIVDANKKVDDK